MTPQSAALQAQFDDLLLLTRDETERSLAIRVADTVVRLRSVDAGLVDSFAVPMRHLPSGGRVDGDADMTVWLMRRDRLDGRVRWRWNWERQRYADDRFEFWALQWAGILVAVDTATGIAILILDEAVVSRLERPEASRPVLEALLSRRGLVSVHGGTVGDEACGVLVAARSGSGKSSIVGYAVSQGFRTTGDDFLYLRPGDEPLLFSAYGTLKVGPSSPAALLVDPDIALVDGKRLGWLPDVAPGCMVESQRPVALVLPVIGDEVAIAPAREQDALTALLPSSLQLSSDRVRAARELTALARSLPCFRLTLAGDPERELEALRSVVPEIEPRATVGA